MADISFRVVQGYMIGTDQMTMRLDVLVGGVQSKIVVEVEKPPSQAGARMRDQKFLVEPRSGGLGAEFASSLVVNGGSLASALRFLADAIDKDMPRETGHAPEALFSLGPAIGG